MIRIGVNKVYGMNDVTTFTEEDFRNAMELNRELAKNSPERNKKLMDELERLETEALMCQTLRNEFEKGRPRTEPSNPFVGVQDPSHTQPKKPEPEKKSFYNYNVFFRSEEPPSVYKLSGDLSSFNEQDIEFNNILPQRVLNDYLENQRKKCIDELSNKDLLKKPFVEPKKEPRSKDELAGRIDEEFMEVPKPPPKPPKKWIRYIDSDGDEYFLNVITGVTQWKRPDNFEE